MERQTQLKPLRPSGKARSSSIKKPPPKPLEEAKSPLVPLKISSKNTKPTVQPRSATYQPKQPQKPKTDELQRLRETVLKNNKVSPIQTIRDLKIQIIENQKVFVELKNQRISLIDRAELEYELLRTMMVRDELEFIMSQSYQEQSEDYTYEELLEIGERMGKVSQGFTEEEIERLKCEKLKSGETCSICLMHMNQGTQACILQPCEHKYHLDCIKTWLVEHKTCPLCLAEIQL
jgi:hypothetical protein